MTRVFFAWELGAGFGHLAPIRALAKALKERGCELTFAVRELGGAQRLLAPLGRLHQAPVRLKQGRNPVRTQVSYASLLHNTGLDDPEEYAGRIAAWRHLMQDTKAQLVFADHSPTALIAAQTLGLPVCNTGIGFAVPPVHTPFPSFQPELKIDRSVLLKNEAEVLKELNQSLSLLGLSAFTALQDMFRNQLAGVYSYPELDPYDCGRAEPYLGLPNIAEGAPPPWPQGGSGPKIFAYLRPMKNLKPILEGLKACKAQVVLRVSDLAPKKIAAFVRPGMTITERPIDFCKAAAECDAFLNYSASSTLAEFLLAGKPGVLVPDLHERILNCRRATALGACLAPQSDNSAEVAAALNRVVEDPAPRKAAVAFAARWHKLDRAAIIPRLAQAALKLV